jgi:hypothetical protein
LWPATEEGNGEPFDYRKIDHSHQSRRTRHALVTHKLQIIYMSFNTLHVSFV